MAACEVAAGKVMGLSVGLSFWGKRWSLVVSAGWGGSQVGAGVCRSLCLLSLPTTGRLSISECEQGRRAADCWSARVCLGWAGVLCSTGTASQRLRNNATSCS